jgi:hypothetical protein
VDVEPVRFRYFGRMIDSSNFSAKINRTLRTGLGFMLCLILAVVIKVYYGSIFRIAIEAWLRLWHLFSR